MMKKCVFFLMVIFMIIKLQGQGYYEITFAGNGAAPQTILVENLTQGTSINMQGTDVLRLNLMNNVREISSFQNSKLTIYPNPMDQSCNFEFSNAQQGRVNIQLVNASGKIIHTYNRELPQGIHKFVLSGVPAGLYFISIETAKDNLSGQFISTSKNNAVFSLSHTEQIPLQNNETSAAAIPEKTDNTLLIKNSKEIVNMDFMAGDQLKLVASSIGFANNTVYCSPTGNQTITFNFTSPFYRITGHTIKTSSPCFVDVMFSVTDTSFIGVDNLTNSNFVVKENDVVVGTSETFRYVRPISAIPYRIKTVLMIDNSASIVNDLSAIKEAAVSLVNNIGDNQEIAVYVFSDAPVLLQNFTNNVDLLTTAINSITLGYATTNLYGSFITGVNAWDDIYTVDSIQKGFLILFTDGDDTQGSSTLQQAVSARGQKSTYMIGLGSNLTPAVLNQLANPAPYYSAATVAQLPEIFEEIQNNIFIYANSFYWLNYMTPKRGGLHNLKIEIQNNNNTGTDSYYLGQFNANGFQSVTYGVYVNTTPTDLYGIDTLSVSNYNPVDLSAVTYWAYAPPVYTWSSSDTSIATVENNSNYFNKAIVNFKGTGGNVAITVNDIANVYNKNVTVITPSAPSVTTTTASSITGTTAVSGGTVTNGGGVAVIERGVCWSTSQNPTTSDSHTYDGTGTGAFTSNITGLDPNTTYYVRAYATNSVGTSYGAQISLTTQNGIINLTTNAITDITTTTATCGGTITGDGGCPVTERGVCWSTSQNPTITDSHTSDGTGTGSYTSNITGLSSGSSYYVRAYATNIVGTEYGSQLTFTTNGTIVVEIINPATGKIWMDRNLGAMQTATSSMDSLAYGDFYQWGRGTDGHELRTSITTTTLSNSNTPGHSNFIIAPNFPQDWRSSQNDNLWQGVSGINNPCPSGFRLPTLAEWQAEVASWSSNNNAGAYSSPLKLTAAGRRNPSAGNISWVGSYGNYWSSTVDTPSSRFLQFSDGGVNAAASSPRASGKSVRCIKD